jgi:hypothetical protein
MTQRRLLTVHVGTPKSGTTYLQRLVARNREELLAHGVLYPGRRPNHFLEVMGLRGAGFRGHTYEGAPQAWEQAVRDIREHPGPALLSHETLGAARKRIVDRLVATFPEHEVRVILTCRDLGRQLPAVWQEKIKNGDTDRYEAFLDAGLDTWEGVGSDDGVWRAQNLAVIARRWAKGVGADNLRLVTVPPPGAEHTALWERFREAAELPVATYRPLKDVRNPSLGAAETELLRRLVEQLPEDLPWPVHSRRIKQRFAERQLSAAQAAGPLIVPADRRSRLDEVATAMVADLREAGYPVVGDLAELTPRYRDDGRSADAVTDGELLERALQMLVPQLLRDDPPAASPQGGGPAAPGR